MSEKRNVIIAQSGGPTPVINNSLRGIIETCHMFPEKFGAVYAGVHGIEGILKEELIDLSRQNAEEIALLRTTPAAGAIGTCRYKLKPDQKEDFQRVVDVFRAHQVGYFFYIGGNDSMDTADKISALAAKQGLELAAVGVAKTIDNDLGDPDFKLVDHTPGYGSVARYWSHIIQNLHEENKGSAPSDPVLVVQTMGRKIGFIPASVRLGDPDREMPLQIYLPESGISLEQLASNVNDELRRSGRCLVVISEGFDVGLIGNRRDAFGHTAYSSGLQTAQQTVVNYLNDVGLQARGICRGQTPGTAQRDTMIYASVVDLEEAYNLGQNAVVIAANYGSGYMSTLRRRPGLIYDVEYDKVPLKIVANSERKFPRHWITSDGKDVTDEFVRYARPLIGNEWVSVPLVDGRQRFARLEKIFAEQKLPQYKPQAYR